MTCFNCDGTGIEHRPDCSYFVDLSKEIEFELEEDHCDCDKPRCSKCTN